MGSSADSAVILIVQDAQLRQALRSSLERADFAVKDYSELQFALMALKALATGVALYFLLDIDASFDECLNAIRDLQHWSHVSVLALSARNDEPTKVATLDAGACDYLVKPFGLGELVARLRAHGRERGRRLRPGSSRWTFGDITADFEQRLVTRSGRRIHLTPIEYKLLWTLATRANAVMTHSELLEAVWGAAHQGDIAYLRVFVNQLRRKIEADAARPSLLITEAGVGYRLLAG